MADSIKLFQTFQKIHQAMGISPSKPNQKQSSINWRNVILYSATIGQAFPVATFLVFEAKSSFEYGFGSFLVFADIVITTYYLIFIWRSEKTFKFIADFEEFGEKRK